jgi:site-specific recombinase XerD
MLKSISSHPSTGIQSSTGPQQQITIKRSVSQFHLLAGGANLQVVKERLGYGSIATTDNTFMLCPPPAK